MKSKRLPLLDSSLISPTLKDSYDLKLVDCNDYILVYLYEKKVIRDPKKDDEYNLSKIRLNNVIDSIAGSSAPTSTNTNELKSIEMKNITRSKLECQRLAKANIKAWKTFITLTFSENITSVEDANKRFRYFIDKVRRVKKDFKYLCITEFQKRGAIHYHLLTNVSIDDNTLLYTQEDNSKYKHIKYWIDGFTSVEPLKNDPKMVIGYIAKYMTKDIDNRLFNRHRYFYSKNLDKPKTNYINLDNEIDCNFYKNKIQDTQLIYQNEYINPYDNSKVIYLEYTK